MNNFRETLTLIFLTILIIFAWSFAMAIITKWLWNGILVNAVDFANPITFWQAFGINVLFDILFKKRTSIKSDK